MKSRGHLGSQLERKAGTVLFLEKDSNEIVTVYSHRTRNAPVFKHEGPAFTWCDIEHRHASCANPHMAKDELMKTDVLRALSEFGKSQISAHWKSTQMKDFFKYWHGVSKCRDSQFSSRLNLAIENGWLRKVKNGIYEASKKVIK
jgi:hypothetical protein